MEKYFWEEKWENNEIGFHMDRPHPLLLKFRPVIWSKSSQHFFLPLCGKTDDIKWLIDNGDKVTGVEFSEIAVKSFFTEKNIQYSESIINGKRVFLSKNLKIFCCDFFEIDKRDIGPVDAIYDRAATVALPEKMRTKYFNSMKELMDAHTKNLLLSFEYEEGTIQGPPFAVYRNEIELNYRGFSVEEIDYREMTKKVPGKISPSKLYGKTYLIEKK